eukprot:2942815-Rhodomonas_salina.1
MSKTAHREGDRSCTLPHRHQPAPDPSCHTQIHTQINTQGAARTHRTRARGLRAASSGPQLPSGSALPLASPPSPSRLPAAEAGLSPHGTQCRPGIHRSGTAIFNASARRWRGEQRGRTLGTSDRAPPHPLARPCRPPPGDRCPRPCRRWWAENWRAQGEGTRAAPASPPAGLSATPGSG